MLAATNPTSAAFAVEPVGGPDHRVRHRRRSTVRSPALPKATFDASRPAAEPAAPGRARGAVRRRGRRLLQPARRAPSPSTPTRSASSSPWSSSSIALGSLVSMAVPISLALFALGCSSLDAAQDPRGPRSPSGRRPGPRHDDRPRRRHRLLALHRQPPPPEPRRRAWTIESSVGRALATSGSAVLFAAITVCIALCGLALIRIPYVTTLGFSAALFVAVTVTAAMTLLPAMLGLLGHKLNSLAIHHRAEPDPSTTVAARWAHEVARRKVLFCVAQPGDPAGPGRAGAAHRPRLHVRLERPDRHHPAPGLRPHGRGLRARRERPAPRGRRPAAAHLARRSAEQTALTSLAAAIGQTPGVKSASAADPQQQRHGRHHRGHPDHRADRPGHRRPGAHAAQRHHPQGHRQRADPRLRRGRRRHHRGRRSTSPTSSSPGCSPSSPG